MTAALPHAAADVVRAIRTGPEGGTRLVTAKLTPAAWQRAIDIGLTLQNAQLRASYERKGPASVTPEQLDRAAFLGESRGSKRSRSESVEKLASRMTATTTRARDIFDGCRWIP